MGLKIGMVATWRSRCGIATYSEALAKALATFDADIYVVRFPRFGRKTNETMRDIAERIPVDRIGVIVVQHEYGLFQGCEMEFYRYLRLFGKPIITIMHAVGHIQLDPKIACLSSKVIVHNEHCRRQFRFPCVVIPHGVSQVNCPPTEDCKKAWGIDPRMKIIGYCGFIAPNKGIETILEAVSKTDSVGLLVAGAWHTAGSTEYINDLKQKSFSLLPSRCQWIGYVPDEKLALAYGAMDMVAYPSLFATESGALLNAIGHGKAVLATSIAPFKEKEELGALMTYTDIEDMIAKIKKILGDEDLKQKLESGARAYSEKFCWANVAQQHIKLYQEVINDCQKVKADLKESPE
jgi:glycosyltransferase involved in cell wall biosynthesis